MRWAPASRFEHSNQELLALYICSDLTIFVFLGGPRGSQGRPWGVPGASLGGPRGAPGGFQGRPRRCQVRAQGIPGIPGVSGDVPGIPGILSIQMIR